MNPTTIQNNDHKIVRFTNVTNFDFTPEMGAMYGGVPYFVQAGKSLLMPMSIGDHIATHLARQIIIQKAPIRDEKETDGKGSDRKLWDENSIKQLKAKIISEVYEEERAPMVTEAQRLAAKVAELNKAFPDGLPVTPAPAAVTQPPADNNHVAPGASQFAAPDGNTYQDKAEVIAALQKRGIKFDARGNKAKLELLLK